MIPTQSAGSLWDLPLHVKPKSFLPLVGTESQVLYPQHWKAVRSLWPLLLTLDCFSLELAHFSEKTGFRCCPPPIPILPVALFVCLFSLWHLQAIVFLKNICPLLWLFSRRVVLNYAVYQWMLSSYFISLPVLSLSPHLYHLFCPTFCEGCLVGESWFHLWTEGCFNSHKNWLMLTKLLVATLCTKPLDNWVDWTWRQKMWLPLLGTPGLRENVCGRWGTWLRTLNSPRKTDEMDHSSWSLWLAQMTFLSTTAFWILLGNETRFIKLKSTRVNTLEWENIWKGLEWMAGQIPGA